MVSNLTFSLYISMTQKSLNNVEYQMENYENYLHEKLHLLPDIQN